MMMPTKRSSRGPIFENRATRRLFGALACGLLWLGSGCGESDDVTIGAVLPLTGAAAAYGKNAKKGMDLALEQINEAGGVGGARLRIVYEDGATQPTTGVSALQKLIQADGVEVVIGEINSSSVLAMAPIAEREQVVMLSPGASNPAISDAGEFIFRNWQSDALEGAVGAEYARESLGWEQIAIMFLNNAYGRGLMEEFTETYEAVGGEVVAVESFAQDASDLRAQILRVRNAGPDGIYLPGFPNELALALVQLAELGVELPVLSTQGFDDPSILDRAGAAANGVVYSIPRPPSESEATVREFREAYTMKYGEEPGICSDSGYDAVRLIAAALEDDATTGPEIRDWLNRVENFAGAAGRTTFDLNGDVIREFVFLQIVDGQPEPHGR